MGDIGLQGLAGMVGLAGLAGLAWQVGGTITDGTREVKVDKR